MESFCNPSVHTHTRTHTHTCTHSDAPIYLPVLALLRLHNAAQHGAASAEQKLIYGQCVASFSCWQVLCRSVTCDSCPPCLQNLHDRCSQYYLTDSQGGSLVTNFAITRRIQSLCVCIVCTCYPAITFLFLVSQFIAAENFLPSSSGTNSSSAVPPIVGVEVSTDWMF